MKVPLLDLNAQYKEIREEVETAIQEVVDSQRFIMGPKIEALEEQIARYCGCRHAVGVSSGTDALLISLMTEGIGFGDRVVTTPYTFFATGGVVARLGATPVFVDIDEQTFNMDPGQLEETISALDEGERSRLKAVMPVHLFGQCAEMEPILKIARKTGLTVIEDAAQAIGSEYAFTDGEVKRAGSMGSYGCFSFFPSKNLGAFGDGGMVTTNDPEIGDRLKIMRVHGGSPKYYHGTIGGNFRLDAIQAAVLLVKLPYLDRWTEGRQENAATYRRLFTEAGLEAVTLPQEKEHRHIYNQFVVQVDRDRDPLKAYLAEKGIGSEIYYPVPLHMQSCFAYLGYRPEDFPMSMRAAEKSLALPIFPELSREQIAYVVEMVVEFFNSP